MKSIRNSHAYNLLPVCQLVVVIDDEQRIDRVADASPYSFAFPIPPFLISLEHLSTVCYTIFLKCKQKASLDFITPYFLLGGPDGIL